MTVPLAELPAVLAALASQLAVAVLVKADALGAWL